MTTCETWQSHLVSIVLPTYNRAYCIARAIDSVISQTYSLWELIVVDNHSSDNTEELVASYSDARIRLIKIHNDGVIASSRNMGINAASGYYVAFLDSDDWWMPTKLEESVRQLDASADVVYHDLYRVISHWHDHSVLRVQRTRQLMEPVFLDLWRNGNAITNSSAVVKRDLLISVGGLSEDRNLISVEDFDIWLRLAQVTERFQKIDKILGYYWCGGGNLSTPHLAIAGVTRLMEKYGEVDLGGGAIGVSPRLIYVLAESYYYSNNVTKFVRYAKAAILANGSIATTLRLVYLLIILSFKCWRSNRLAD
jgi:glycosyltransferase involved in cell wall biosynthesis